ncbi:MAG TPA: FG-GAP-like repeat-containing protein [Bacteroidia bacterium]|nr:FG-GAP-like repeat-containing protein [Bacteroidia bacterium]
MNLITVRFTNLACIILFCFATLVFASKTSAQILGNYSPVTLSVGANANISPTAAPSNTSRMAVFASGEFSGLLTAVATTGIVTITDAKPVGSYTITVVAFSSSGLSTTKTFTLIVNNTECNDGRFNGNTNYPIIRNNLTGIAIGDFNGDNKQDLLAAHIGYNSVSIRFGNGTGGFTGSSEEVVSSHPYAIAVGDFNRDGKQDFVVSNEGADLVAVRLGDGTGSFSSMPNVHVGNAPAIVAIGDFNNDAKQDFAVANFHSNNVSICLGDGSGNFTITSNINVGTYPECIAISDFNRDGKQDFAVTNSGSQSVSIRLGNGMGGFSAMPDVPVGFNPYNVVIADFNRDGNVDIAVTNYSSNTVSIRFGDGTGGFTGNDELPVPGGPYSITIGNFNGDDFPDLAITNYFSNKVSIRLGDGAGGFYGNSQVIVGSYPVCVVAGDFNGDKRQDIAVANYNDHSISVRLGMMGIPSISPVASNSPRCTGQSLQLFASGGSSYSWSGPNGFSSNDQNPEIPMATVAHSGIYSLSLVDVNNCTATLSTIARVNPLPVVTFTLTQDSLCTFDPALTLGGGSPLGGTYSGPGVVGGNTFDPAITGAGFYYLHYTYVDSNDCANSEFDKMNVVLCNSVNLIENDQNISFFPNPVKDNFSIDLSSFHGQLTMDILGGDGRCVRHYIEDDKKIHQVSTLGLSPGIYTLIIRSMGQTKTARIVKVE